MGKKMSFTSLFKHNDTTSPWSWPSCTQPNSDSFRAYNDVYKTVSSIFIDTGDEILTTSDSSFSNSTECRSFSTASEKSNEEPLECVIRGLRSERFFVEPDNAKSIMKAKAGGLPFEESVVLAVESKDPYADFRVSMEEMVEAHALKDWDCLEELLQWYLRVNRKKTHEYIVQAFVDLLVGLVSSSLEGDEEHYSPFHF